MEEYEKKFLETVKAEIDYWLERKREELEDGDDYVVGYDSDYVNNGLGNECVRRDAIYDEDALEADAREKVVGASDDIIEELRKAFSDFVEGYLK